MATVVSLVRSRASAFILLLVVMFALPTGTSDEPHDPVERKAIQPGAPINFLVDAGEHSIGGCTLAFVYEDAEGALFITTAGHCVDDVGQRVAGAGIGEFGTVVYRENELRVTDLAIIEIDLDQYEHVSPSMRMFGGPTGVQEDFTPNQLVVHHGNGVGYGTNDVTRNRVGKLDFVKTEDFWGDERGWYVATHPVIGGDSGSAILTGDGKALGWISASSIDGGTLTGPTALHVQQTVLDEMGLTLVTAPFIV